MNHSFNHPNSLLQHYFNDNRREFLIVNKAEVALFFGLKNRRFLQNTIRQKVEENTKVEIPDQEETALTETQIKMMDFYPRGTKERWNHMTIDFAVKRIGLQAMKMFHMIRRHARAGARQRTTALPQNISITGEKSRDIDYNAALIRRGESGPGKLPRQSRRHGLITFLKDSAKTFDYSKLGSGRQENHLENY